MRRDQGSATVIVLCISLVAIFVLTGVVGVGRMAVTRAKVSAAADLAALAGAAGGGCEVAQATARANGAELDDCRAEGPDVVVVAVRDVRLAGREFAVRARARAGPP